MNDLRGALGWHEDFQDGSVALLQKEVKGKVSDRLSGFPAKLRGASLMRSGMVTTLSLAVLLAGLAALRLVHVKNRVTKLAELPQRADSPVARPGNQDLITLNRVSMVIATTPEFSAATLTPGVGMMVQQIKLILPERGEVPILVATPAEDLIRVGKNVMGAPFSVMVQNREGNRWLPGVEAVTGRGADMVGNNSMPDGGEASGTFPAVAGGTNFGVETKVTANLSGRAIELSMTVKNVSDSPRAVTIAWRPKVLAPETGLSSLTLSPPMAALVNGKQTDYAVSTPVHFGQRDENLQYGDLKRSYLSNGPELRLRNEADSYVLHMTALSPSIRSLNVQSNRDDKSVSIMFSTASGSAAGEPGTVIAPGDSLQWHVRMDAMAISTFVQPKD